MVQNPLLKVIIKYYKVDRWGSHAYKQHLEVCIVLL